MTCKSEPLAKLPVSVERTNPCEFTNSNVPNDAVDIKEPLIVSEPPPWKEPLIASGSATFVKLPPSPNNLPNEPVESIEPVICPSVNVILPVSIVNEPVRSIEPVKMCVSSIVSPNSFEPDE